jgi:2-amino-4-hydroxy-6-hydroxymethyldihydropteridine diphosphokinase
MPRDWVSVYLGLGANLGDAHQAVSDAIVSLSGLSQTRLLASSSMYRSSPVQSQGPDFINAVVHLETQLNAFEFLQACQHIENQAGRVRPYVNAPRTLDLDVLLFGEATICSTFLQVPHPRMLERAFVMLPLSELAPEWVSAVNLESLTAQGIQKLTAHS